MCGHSVLRRNISAIDVITAGINWMLRKFGAMFRPRLCTSLIKAEWRFAAANKPTASYHIDLWLAKN